MNSDKEQKEMMAWIGIACWIGSSVALAYLTSRQAAGWFWFCGVWIISTVLESAAEKVGKR